MVHGSYIWFFTAIYPKDTFKVKTTLLSQSFPEGLTKILLGIPTVYGPTLKVYRQSRQRAYRKYIPLPPLVYSFELWLFILNVSRHLKIPPIRNV